MSWENEDYAPDAPDMPYLPKEENVNMSNANTLKKQANESKFKELVSKYLQEIINKIKDD